MTDPNSPHVEVTLDNAETETLFRAWLDNDVTQGIEWLRPAVEHLIADRLVPVTARAAAAEAQVATACSLLDNASAALNVALHAAKADPKDTADALAGCRIVLDYIATDHGMSPARLNELAADSTSDVS